MEAGSQRPKGRDGALPSLTTAIDALDLVRNTTTMKPAKDAFTSANSLLATIRVSLPLIHLGGLFTDCTQDSTIDEENCVELGLTCADACQALHRGVNGSGVGQPNQSVLDAIDQLTT
jgi:hypothetical protein